MMHIDLQLQTYHFHRNISSILWHAAGIKACIEYLSLHQ